MHRMGFMVCVLVTAIFGHCQFFLSPFERGRNITRHCIAEAEKWYVFGALFFKVQDHTQDVSLPDYNFL